MAQKYIVMLQQPDKNAAVYFAKEQGDFKSQRCDLVSMSQGDALDETV